MRVVTRAGTRRAVPAHNVAWPRYVMHGAAAVAAQVTKPVWYVAPLLARQLVFIICFVGFLRSQSCVLIIVVYSQRGRDVLMRTMSKETHITTSIVSYCGCPTSFRLTIKKENRCVVDLNEVHVRPIWLINSLSCRQCCSICIQCHIPNQPVSFCSHPHVSSTTKL